MKKIVVVPNFDQQTGLVTVIVVKKMKETLGLPGGIILMVAHANEEAFRLTLETGYAHFWSRSRKKIWKKGETSGNFIPICELRMDCDSDAVIYYTNVSLSGLASCHLGTVSCFSKVPDIERDSRPQYEEFEVHSNFSE